MQKFSPRCRNKISDIDNKIIGNNPITLLTSLLEGRSGRSADPHEALRRQRGASCRAKAPKGAWRAGVVQQQ